LIKMPDYIGPMAFGVKMGVILPGMDIVEKVFESLELCSKDGLLAGGDVVCVTESVVARAQNNYVTLDRIAQEISEKLKLKEDSKIAVLFPIASRNRFQ
jgi:F420-0:gamma-glutamyl ligase